MVPECLEGAPLRLEDHLACLAARINQLQRCDPLGRHLTLCPGLRHQAVRFGLRPHELHADVLHRVGSLSCRVLSGRFDEGFACGTQVGHHVVAPDDRPRTSNLGMYVLAATFPPVTAA